MTRALRATVVVAWILGGWLVAGTVVAQDATGEVGADAVDATGAADVTDAPVAVDAAVPDAISDAGPDLPPDPGSAATAEPVPVAEPQPPTAWSPKATGVVPDRVVRDEPGLFVPEPVVSTSTSTWLALKVIAGLLALLALAYLGGHKRVVRYQEQLGLGGVITAGFAYIALGLIARQPAVGILTDAVLGRLQPVLHFGLGWLGFIIGAQLDIRVLDRVPRGTAYLILVETLGPFAVAAAACGAVMVTVFDLSWRDPDLWRDLVLLGAAAAMSAPRRFRGFANRAWRKGRPIEHLLGQLDELAGVIVLLFVTAFFRDVPGESWHLPATAWIFVSLGLGVAIGTLIFAMVRVPVSNAEFLAVVLGGIAFASGFAGYLHLSPTVVCFLAGVLVTNFPNEQRGGVFRILNHLERPVRLLFLIIAGALWQVGDWRGWVLVPLLVVGRVAGKWLGVTASRAATAAEMPESFTHKRKLLVPLSSLSIALVVSIERLQVSPSLPWVMTAVIGGALLTEVLVQQLSKAPVEDPGASQERMRPIDELDEDPDA